MREGPDISRIASLIGDPARAVMLELLSDGRALTAMLPAFRPQLPAPILLACARMG
jgi:hypothetical protein